MLAAPVACVCGVPEPPAEIVWEFHEDAVHATERPTAIYKGAF